jgi:hypothetical protein
MKFGPYIFSKFYTLFQMKHFSFENSFTSYFKNTTLTKITLTVS